VKVRSGGPRRIGIFGGTFDPPHVGHLVAAVEARDALALDVVLLVVANVPWQKVGSRAISPAADRLAMVRAAVADEPGLEVSDLEIRRGGDTYTADTLADLRAEEPDAELFVVVGADAAAGFTTWDRYEQVAEEATLVVVDRPGAGGPLDARFPWVRVDIPELEVSSTDLRARVAAGRSVRYLTPDAVATCIAERGLYC
jgi:nicotinate-nucleotide adenylyltransferase